MDPLRFLTLKSSAAVRAVGLGALCLVVCALCAPFANVIEAFGGEGFGRIDLLQYWAAARLFLGGQNPYDPHALKLLQQEVSAFAGLPVLMWNPPVLLPFIAPLGLLPFPVAVGAAFLSALILLAGSTMLLVSRFEIRARRVALAYVLSFYPFALSVFYGQISPLLLLGLCGMIALLGEAENDDRRMLLISAGALLSLVVVKPHLLYLPVCYLLLNWRVPRVRMVLCGAAGMLAIMVVLVALVDARVFGFYSMALHAPPVYWKTPTIGSFLQGWTGSAALRVVPMLCGIAALVWWQVRVRSEFSVEHFLLLVPLSLVTSPYGWVYDQMLLLPCGLYCIARAEVQSRGVRMALYGLLFGANIVMMLVPGGQEQFVWFPVVTFVAMLLVQGNVQVHEHVHGSL